MEERSLEDQAIDVLTKGSVQRNDRTRHCKAVQAARVFLPGLSLVALHKEASMIRALRVLAILAFAVAINVGCRVLLHWNEPRCVDAPPFGWD